jgi:Na+-transporting NADH:ubiquinone oxidoreductase subunit B
MNLLRKLFDAQRRHFSAEGRLTRLGPFFNAMEKVFFGSAQVTVQAPHSRDSLNVQRYMMLVVVMLLPCLFFGMYNVGLQAFKAADQPLSFWPMLGFGAKIVFRMGDRFRGGAQTPHQ